MIVQEDILAHVGIMGMKWGHRKTYGLSKGQLKKQINTSKKTELTSVQKKYHNALTKAMTDSGLIDSYKSMNKKKPMSSTEYATWNKKAIVVRRDVAKQHISDFNKATLKDIKYEDVKKGKAMLKTYDMNYKVSNYGVSTTYGLGTTIY